MFGQLFQFGLSLLSNASGSVSALLLSLSPLPVLVPAPTVLPFAACVVLPPAPLPPLLAPPLVVPQGNTCGLSLEPWCGTPRLLPLRFPPPLLPVQK